MSRGERGGALVTVMGERDERDAGGPTAHPLMLLPEQQHSVRMAELRVRTAIPCNRMVRLRVQRPPLPRTPRLLSLRVAAATPRPQATAPRPAPRPSGGAVTPVRFVKPDWLPRPRPTRPGPAGAKAPRAATAPSSAVRAPPRARPAGKAQRWAPGWWPFAMEPWPPQGRQARARGRQAAHRPRRPASYRCCPSFAHAPPGTGQRHAGRTPHRPCTCPHPLYRVPSHATREIRPHEPRSCARSGAMHARLRPGSAASHGVEVLLA